MMIMVDITLDYYFHCHGYSILICVMLCIHLLLYIYRHLCHDMYSPITMATVYPFDLCTPIHQSFKVYVLGIHDIIQLIDYI